MPTRDDPGVDVLIEGSGPTTLKVRGQGGMWPFHRIMLNGQALPTSFVSKDEIHAIIAEARIDMIVMPDHGNLWALDQTNVSMMELQLSVRQTKRS